MVEKIVEGSGFLVVFVNVIQSSLDIIAKLPISNISILVTLLFSIGFLIWKTNKMRNEAKIKKLEYLQKLDECHKAGIDTSSVE